MITKDLAPSNPAWTKKSSTSSIRRVFLKCSKNGDDLSNFGGSGAGMAETGSANKPTNTGSMSVCCQNVHTYCVYHKSSARDQY